MERKDVKPVVKIRPEFSRSDRRLQIAIGGRQHTDVDGDGMCPSHAFEFALLQHAQKRDLALRRDIADLVQKDGPVVRPFKASQMPLSRSSEGAFLVSKQFGGDQRRWNRGAVYLNEWARRPMGAFMNGTGRQFFSSAALAGNQHRGLGGGTLLYFFQTAPEGAGSP